MPSDHESSVSVEGIGYEQTNGRGATQRRDADGLKQVQSARRHAKRNNHVCPICGQAFIRGEHLRRHEQSRKSTLYRTDPFAGPIINYTNSQTVKRSRTNAPGVATISLEKIQCSGTFGIFILIATQLPFP